MAVTGVLHRLGPSIQEEPVSAAAKCLATPAGLRHVAALALLLAPGLLLAGNGIYPTGYGAVSATMSGTDLAVADDTSAFATNPAGLVQITGQQADAHLTVFNTLRTGHADGFGNDQGMHNDWAGLLGGGYAAKLGDRPLVAGVGLFVQGGLGYVYKDLETAFGSQDELSFLLSVVKLTPGLAWQVNDRLAVGATAGITYAAARQKFFADTSVFDPAQPQNAFFGLRVDGMSTFNVGARVGLRYQLSETLLLAAAYASPVNLDMDGGSVTVNYEALGQGRVRYRDASLQGFELPAEAGLALAWRPRGNLLASIETSWFDWGGSLDSVRLQAARPDGAAPVATIDAETAVALRSRFLTSLGLRWWINEDIDLRAGYAWGKRPQPDRTLSPVLPLITEHDVSLGLGYRVDRNWTLQWGLEFQPYTSRFYTNPQAPFGANARESNEVILVHMMVTRRW